MLETFTPAVCGSRKRQRAASLLFTVSAAGAAAALGALLGLAGAALGIRHVVFVAAALALVGMTREAGLVRFPLPQWRRQVPEAWRFQLPLPVWAVGYGAGLGVGLLTYQPVSTFWVAGAGALALGRPLPAAVCFGLYGVGRAAMIVWPRRRADDPTEAVERLSRRAATVLRVNAAALAVCAALLALAPAAGGAVYAAGLDPAADGGVVAWASQDGSVIVRDGGTEYPYSPAAGPDLDGDLLAYVDAEGIRIVRWRTGQEVRRIAENATAVALDWPLLAYRREDSTRRRLVLRNLDTGARWVVTTVFPTTDLGRPSLSGRRLVWHVATRGGSHIRLLNIAKGRRFTLARSKIVLLRNPAIDGTRVVWAAQRSGSAAIRTRSVWRRTVRTVARISSRDLEFWSTALDADRVYATRWSLGSGTAMIYSFQS